MTVRSKFFEPRNETQLREYLDEFRTRDSTYTQEVKKILDLFLKYEPEIDQLKLCKKYLKTLQLIIRRRSVIDRFKQSFSDDKNEFKGSVVSNKFEYQTATVTLEGAFDQFIVAGDKLLKTEEFTIRNLWQDFLTIMVKFSQTNDSILGLNRDYILINTLIAFNRCFLTIDSEKLKEITECVLDLLLDRVEVLEKTIDIWQQGLYERIDNFSNLHHFFIMNDRWNKVKAEDNIDGFLGKLKLYINLARDLEYVSMSGEILIVTLQDEDIFMSQRQSSQKEKLPKEKLDIESVTYLKSVPGKRALIYAKEHSHFSAQCRPPLKDSPFFEKLTSIAREKEITKEKVEPFFTKREHKDSSCHNQSQCFSTQMRELEKKLASKKDQQIASLVVKTNYDRLECQFYLIVIFPLFSGHKYLRGICYNMNNSGEMLCPIEVRS